jgi:hypothetical protein
MRSDERLIVFAHARSGSSSLYEMLQLHPELDVLHEPFHPSRGKWVPPRRDFRSEIHDAASLDAVLREIFADYDGLNTLAYQLPTELNRSMLLAPRRKIVFIRRRNLLKSVVSALIAEQTELWKPWEAKKPVLEYYAELRPLSMDEARAQLEETHRTIELYRQLLASLPPDRCHEVVFEDFFLVPPDEKRARLREVFAFLELEPPEGQAVERFLDPAHAQLNTDETYARVPNLRELDDALGSDETGRIFDGATA